MERTEQVKNEAELNLLHLVDSEELRKGHIEELFKMERQRWIFESEDEGEMRL